MHLMLKVNLDLHYCNWKEAGTVQLQNVITVFVHVVDDDKKGLIHL